MKLTLQWWYSFNIVLSKNFYCTENFSFFYNVFSLIFMFFRTWYSCTFKARRSIKSCSPAFNDASCVTSFVSDWRICYFICKKRIVDDLYWCLVLADTLLSTLKNIACDFRNCFELRCSSYCKETFSQLLFWTRTVFTISKHTPSYINSIGFEISEQYLIKCSLLQNNINTWMLL